MALPTAIASTFAAPWFDCFLKYNNSDHSLPMMRAYINSFDTPNGKWKVRPGRWIKEKNWPSNNIQKLIFNLSKGSLSSSKGSGTININTPQSVGITGGYNCPGMRIENELPNNQSK